MTFKAYENLIRAKISPVLLEDTTFQYVEGKLRWLCVVRLPHSGNWECVNGYMKEPNTLSQWNELVELIVAELQPAIDNLYLDQKLDKLSPDALYTLAYENVDTYFSSAADLGKSTWGEILRKTHLIHYMTYGKEPGYTVVFNPNFRQAQLRARRRMFKEAGW